MTRSLIALGLTLAAVGFLVVILVGYTAPIPIIPPQ